MPPPDLAASGPVSLGKPDDARRQSLPGAHRSVRVPAFGSFWQKLAAFTGPGYLVAVGYMDPGNWATGIAGGSAFGYQLLSVVVIANLMAVLLQSLSAKLGIVTGLDLAQACRERYRPVPRMALWLLCEVAIVACELAEVIGTAVALQLLFGIPLIWGILLTAVNVAIIMALERTGFRKLEAVIVALMILVALCLGIELVLSRPDLAAIGAGLIPSRVIVTDPAMLYLATGILGATVMPHNLYLHSAVVQTRRFALDASSKREAIRFATLDSSIALSLALLINAAILILAASTFHHNGRIDVAEIGEAYHLLAPLLGVGFASVLFGVALLASGQNSAVTGVLAGQVVMEGFTDLRMPIWARRMISRMLAIVPAAIVAMLYGERGVSSLLILSQVVLSLQLPFAIVPLVRLTSDKHKMGVFANSRRLAFAAWAVAALVIALNAKLLFDFFSAA
jgi:manganese transport protein